MEIFHFHELIFDQEPLGVILILFVCFKKYLIQDLILISNI